ncbi:hypothetical protein ACGFSD_05340 [Streptomyces caniferus]|uniref:DUF7224 domain-containing protein n=1 Tax=Streptomyces caniferus TaxID=285557 RepID=UPI0037224AE7
MNVKALLRTSSATFLAAPVLVFTFFVAYSSGNLAQYDNRHPPTVSAAAFQALIFAAATVAGCGAWEAGRLRQSGIWDLAPWRSKYRIAAQRLSLPVALGVAVMMVMTVMRFVQASVFPDAASLPAVVIGLLLPIPYAVIGFAIGNVSRSPVICAPLVMAGTWFFIGYAGNNSTDIPGTLWLRHATAYTMSSPEIDQVISPVALLVPVVFTCAVAGAATLLWGPWRSATRIALAGLLAVSGLATSCAVASSWGYRTPMTTSALAEKCSNLAGVNVCVPELYQDMLPRVQTTASSIVERLHRAGVPAPKKVTHTRLDASAGLEVWHIWFLPRTSTGELAESLAHAPLNDAEWSCLGRKDFKRADALELWLRSAAGLDSGDAASDRGTVTAVEKVKTLPVGEQAAWFAQAQAQARSCGKAA